jgi:hypothetical protein
MDIILYERTSLLLQIRSCFKNWFQLGFSIPCPLFLNYTCKGTESFYDYIAKTGTAGFGKKDQCMIPTKELNAKFLE